MFQSQVNENKDYKENKNLWEKEIIEFTTNCIFHSLEILEFIDGTNESFVTFTVNLTCNNEDNTFTEKSKFKKIDNKWYYHSGEFNKDL